MAEIDYRCYKDTWFELLDLEPAARAARLEALAGEDAALAARLRAQLAASERPLALLDHVGDGDQPPQLAHYELIRELGRGGMGRVWLAQRRLGDAVQRVALKQIAHAAWDEDDRRRFERERRILATLRHPNIAALVDGGSDALGAPFLATAFVDGERIDRHVQSQELGVDARVRLVVKLAEAVAYAHRELVVHRDLKPANILVGADGEPMLLDFGIARLLGEEAITTTGPSQMTLRYAAPEQVRGEAGHVGVGADVYALGVLLYELLAGVSPYDDTSDQAALLMAILQATPRPPSSRARGLDGDLDAIVLKALRKRPQDRYAGADALAADLQRWLAREPVEARRGERGYRARAWLRRRWPWLAAAALALAFVGYHLAMLDRQVAQVERERDKALALAGFFGRLFENAPPAATERGEVSARELLERSITQLREDRDQPPDTRAALLHAAGSALAYLGQARQARDAFETALGLLAGQANADPELLAMLHGDLAASRYKLGQLAPARAANAQALALFERGLAHDVDNRLSYEQQAAIYADDAGDAAGARAGYLRVVDIARARLDTPRGLRSYLAAQINLALGELRSDSAQAERRLQEALRSAAEHGFEDRGLLLPMRNYLARALVNQRKLDAARPLHAAVLAEARAHYGSDDPWLDVITYHYATLAMLDGRGAEAARLLDAAIARDLARGNEASAWLDREHRATAALLAGDWHEAAERLRAAIGQRDRSGSGEGPTGRFLRAQLAYAQCRLEPSEANRNALREALARNEGWSGWVTWFSADLQRACDAAGTP